MINKRYEYSTNNPSASYAWTEGTPDSVRRLQNPSAIVGDNTTAYYIYQYRLYKITTFSGVNATNRQSSTSIVEDCTIEESGNFAGLNYHEKMTALNQYLLYFISGKFHFYPSKIEEEAMLSILNHIIRHFPSAIANDTIIDAETMRFIRYPAQLEKLSYLRNHFILPDFTADSDYDKLYTCLSRLTEKQSAKYLLFISDMYIGSSAFSDNRNLLQDYYYYLTLIASKKEENDVFYRHVYAFVSEKQDFCQKVILCELSSYQKMIQNLDVMQAYFSRESILQILQGMLKKSLDSQMNTTDYLNVVADSVDTIIQYNHTLSMANEEQLIHMNFQLTEYLNQHSVRKKISAPNPEQLTIIEYFMKSLEEENLQTSLAQATCREIHFLAEYCHSNEIDSNLLKNALKDDVQENLDFIETLNDIKEGDYIVHMIHGIGVFRGLSKQSIDNEEKDYLTLEYARGDKLHIPAEQINMLCRYRGSGSVLPPLSKMGGNDWNSTKAKVKKSIEDVAQDLINLYALRKISKGYAFEPDTLWQYEMEEAFPYTETPDQMKAINETKEDMELERPMDRLICGDVGFGKTEVAIRAIFKAIMSSKQAAVVVPTTILALQHFQTISERFKPYPIRVELLSRFKTQKEQKKIINKLILGEVDVVIGTHRLLQNDIQFKDLGLLVIDEEHKFGVKDKEKLKKLKKNIDILTMSATPIPRTLYMSLSGIKDMSIINTPPTNRLPVKTFVSEFKENMVKNAINYEIEREGQIFYLYNRVESIYEFAANLKNLLPNIRLAVAHGQMDKHELERIMTEFLNHEYDVLLCTTIIESGLDIPNANTMIIHDADRFGLAQLYQIRGRVGRTDRQAFCYCFYKAGKLLTQDAVKRLKYIKEFTTLGSGYQIAMRDIEIRGVGNVLGTKQHGQMVNVGFDTYCRLLEDAVGVEWKE